MALDLTEELLKLTRLLEARGLPYALCGGVAVGLHGFPRATKDLDLLIQESDLEATLNVANDAGFVIPAGMIRFNRGKPTEWRLSRISKVDGEELFTLDLIIVTPILADIWDSKVMVMAGQDRIQVVSRDGLIKMKSLSGRPIDQRDVLKLSGEADG